MCVRERQRTPNHQVNTCACWCDSPLSALSRPGWQWYQQELCPPRSIVPRTSSPDAQQPVSFSSAHLLFSTWQKQEDSEVTDRVDVYEKYGCLCMYWLVQIDRRQRVESLDFLHSQIELGAKHRHAGGGGFLFEEAHTATRHVTQIRLQTFQMLLQLLRNKYNGIVLSVIALIISDTPTLIMRYKAEGIQQTVQNLSARRWCC